VIVAANPLEITRAAKALLRGELVAFPTETVYGLGALASNQTAVQRIFLAKGRPSHNPLIVHLHSPAQLSTVAIIQPGSIEEQRLIRIQALWPGPLTVILPKSPLVARAACAGLSTVALRIPSHPVALRLLEAVDAPIAAPSANPSGYVSPTTAQHVEEALANKVAMVIDGGPCTVGLESTIVDLTGALPRILRPGEITIETVSSVLGERVENGAMMPSQPNPVLAPGMLEEHYAPRTALRLRDSLCVQEYPALVGLICFSMLSSDADKFDYAAVSVLSAHGDLHEVAAQLFSAIREQDHLNLDLIVVDSCPSVGVGLAIMDRLYRASARTSRRRRG